MSLYKDVKILGSRALPAAVLMLANSPKYGIQQNLLNLEFNLNCNKRMAFACAFHDSQQIPNEV